MESQVERYALRKMMTDYNISEEELLEFLDRVKEIFKPFIEGLLDNLDNARDYVMNYDWDDIFNKVYEKALLYFEGTVAYLMTIYIIERITSEVEAKLVLYAVSNEVSRFIKNLAEFIEKEYNPFI